MHFPMYLRLRVSGSRPAWTRTSHVQNPRRMIWPVLRAISPLMTKDAAHIWHTWPMQSVGFVGGSEKGRLTGVQHSAVSVRAHGLARSRAHNRHTGAD